MLISQIMNLRLIFLPFKTKSSRAADVYVYLMNLMKLTQLYTILLKNAYLQFLGSQNCIKILKLQMSKADVM